MQIILDFGKNKYEPDLAKPYSLARPITFDNADPTAFGAPHGHRETFKAGSFTGNVAAGGSCNCESFTLIPHCNGTHTECIGHITGQRISVNDVLKESFIPARLITVLPGSAGNETYMPAPAPGDRVITKEILEAQICGNYGFMDALVIRTNITANTETPPYFTHEAMRHMAKYGVKHLLVDMPSVDRLDDGGLLSNHRIFWDVEPGATDAKPSPKTITELIHVPDELDDGQYLLNLQIAPFDADAAPSRPVLYRVFYYVP